MEFIIEEGYALCNILYGEKRVTQVVTKRYATKLIQDHKKNKLNPFWEHMFRLKGVPRAAMPETLLALNKLI